MATFTTTRTFSAEVESIVKLGVRFAKQKLAEGVTSVGGVPRTKTRTQKLMEAVQLDTVALVLDRMKWWGEWGHTTHGIEMELIRRAKEKA